MLKMIRADAAEVIAKVVQTARSQFEYAGLKLEVKAPTEPAGVLVDIDRIVRVFRNLLDNALKFTERHGRVSVEVEARPDCVRFSVANSGPALQTEQLDNMFQGAIRPARDRPGLPPCGRDSRPRLPLYLCWAASDASFTAGNLWTSTGGEPAN